MRHEDQVKIPSNPNPTQRKPLLSVIYFIDSNKTHSFKIPVKTSIYLIMILAAFTGWGGVCSIFLYQQVQRSHSKQAYIENLRQIIFDYQVQYDQVYERTYPKELEEPTPATATAVVAQTNPINVSSETSQTPVQSTQTSSEKLSATQIKQTQPASISIEAINPAINEDALVLAFGIRNQISPSKIDGNLWGVAAFETNSGNIIEISAPRGLENQSQAYLLKNLNKTEPFSIKYYKEKVFTFQKPKEPGKFSKVTIFAAKHGHIYPLKILNRDDLLKKDFAKASSANPKEEAQ